MTKRSISDIAQNGGFPRAIEEVSKTFEPLIVTVRGEPVVVIYPCPPAMGRLLNDTENFVQAIGKLLAAGLKDELKEYLLSQFTLGIMAQGILTDLEPDNAQLLANYALSMVDKMSQQIKALKPQVTEAMEYIEAQKHQKNDIAEISIPSQSRKRGRPRKES